MQNVCFRQERNIVRPSLISLMVFVDVKHHVYLLNIARRTVQTLFSELKVQLRNELWFVELSEICSANKQFAQLRLEVVSKWETLHLRWAEHDGWGGVREQWSGMLCSPCAWMHRSSCQSCCACCSAVVCQTEGNPAQNQKCIFKKK